ncbi:putative peptidase C45 [Dioscorea sansibarensis]
MLEVFDVAPCEDGYRMGFLIGQRFSDLIRSRAARDVILQEQLLPFAQTPPGRELLEALSINNKEAYPRYWDEMLGMAEGSGIKLLNFRKEVLPFVHMQGGPPEAVGGEDCSDVLVVNDSLAVAAHNEDANVALVGHAYVVRVALPNGLSFTAYTYAGELPSCAFGFNHNGVAFTLNAVPPADTEIMAGGIGRNFISRDLLEAAGLEDALIRIRSANASVGHSYNLVDVRNRKILNVETASGNRISVHEVGATPFFHANMYLHLQMQQVPNESSLSRQRRAAQLSAESKAEILSVLGDSADEKCPIYMTALYTLCTVLIDLDQQVLSIHEGNPKKGEVICVFPIVRK